MMDKRTQSKIKRSHALLIDEISMMNGQLFDILECMITIIRCYDEVKEKLKEIQEQIDSKILMSDHMLKMRGDESNGFGALPAWGGLQIIVVGDFFQLPPVASGNDEPLYNSVIHTSEPDLKVGRQGCYAFESRAWRRCNFEEVELIEVRRQSDGTLYEFLNDMRAGVPYFASKHENVIHALQKPLPIRDDGVRPTELHTKNKTVDERNKQELDRLPHPCIDFHSTDKVSLAYEFLEKFLERHGIESQHLSYDNLLPTLRRRARIELESEMEAFERHTYQTFFSIKESRVPELIELKKDSQCMLLWNLDVPNKLANGSVGIVKEFVDPEDYADMIEREIKRREQKMKQQQHDNNSDEKKDSDANHITTETGSDIAPQLVDDEISTAVSTWLSELSASGLISERDEMEEILKTKVTDLPFVHFVAGPKRVIRPQAFEKHYKKCGTATRWQIPLTLAWAVTVHKSQGMTIDFLSVGKFILFYRDLSLFLLLNLLIFYTIALLPDLLDCFADGQAYVACSRGRSLDSMTVQNFKASEIKTSAKVKEFYRLMAEGKSYPTIWADTIAEFDQKAKQRVQHIADMKRIHGDKQCSVCGRVCDVRQVQSNVNNNRGRWYWKCPDQENGNGHCFEWITK